MVLTQVRTQVLLMPPSTDLYLPHCETHGLNLAGEGGMHLAFLVVRGIAVATSLQWLTCINLWSFWPRARQER
jgi:hypothetical protein